MLRPPYHWRIREDAAFLDYNARNVANVQCRQGAWTLTIVYQQKRVSGPCGSLRLGIRFAERWIQARGAGMPGMGRVRWYEAVQSVQSGHQNAAIYGTGRR